MYYNPPRAASSFCLLKSVYAVLFVTELYWLLTWSFHPSLYPTPVVWIPPLCLGYNLQGLGYYMTYTPFILKWWREGRGGRTERNSYSKRTIPYSTEPFRTPLGHPHPLCYFLYPPPSTSATCCKERGRGLKHIYRHILFQETSVWRIPLRLVVNTHTHYPLPSSSQWFLLNICTMLHMLYLIEFMFVYNCTVNV